MIRGTTAQFKFHMPYAFNDLCIIEVTFWQPGKTGTTEAPFPITRVYNRQYIAVDDWTSEDADETKVYYYDGKYYKKEGEAWTGYDNIEDVTRNDGIAAEDNDVESKTLLVSLTPAETLRFYDTCKGYVQIKAYCDTNGITFASKTERFMVYPVKNEDVFGDIGQSVEPNTGVQILDAGELK